mmetsp:Transcript_63885/g.138956  ORF Transcript_63885/g.138956 Transcript_63885/m.138956 type:complete len:106 (+) Transcript_63885:92-409(+)
MEYEASVGELECEFDTSLTPLASEDWAWYRWRVPSATGMPRLQATWTCAMAATLPAGLHLVTRCCVGHAMSGLHVHGLRVLERSSYKAVVDMHVMSSTETHTALS